MKKDYRPYRNRFEQQTAISIAEHGVKSAYESTKLDYTVSGRYLVDFEILTATSKKIYIETKGNGLSFDGHVKRKLIAVKQQHPEIDLRIVFYSDGKCGPKRKDGTFMRQSDWATKYGFKWAIKTIPEEWYAE